MNDDKILCPRCGEEMKRNSRYCMKCGYLNYDHPENAAMKSYMGKLQESTNYVNGKVEVRQFKGVKRGHEIRFGSNTGSKKICFLVNSVLYICALVITYLLYSRQYNQVIDIVYSSMPFMYMLITLIFMYLYSIELIFMKMNERWWSALIPIYNMFILSYRGMGNYLFGILSLIPVVNIFYLLVLFYKIGQKFKFNGILFMIFWPLFIPVCGFGANPFDDITYVAGLEDNALEKEYKLKNFFITVSITMLVLCLSLEGYLNRALLADPIESIKRYYYVYASRGIVNNVKTDIRLRTINCTEGVYMRENNGEYYFYYPSAGDKASLLFNNSREEIEAYVKVVNLDGKSTYYISLTDGTYGILEKEVTEISVKDVIEMQNLPENYKYGNNCSINKA